jgi:hypothetical protein
MTRCFLIITFLIITFATDVFSQERETNEKLREIVRSYGQAEVTVPYRDAKSTDLITRNVSILSVKDKKISISLSPLTIDWFLSQKYEYTILPKSDGKGIVTALNLNQAVAWETYPTFTQYDSIMRSFVSLYPSLCRLDTIGKSVNGKLIMVLKISDNVSVDETEPEVLYSSTIHGDETGGFILMLRLADYLLRNYQTSSRVKNMVDNLEIWINPLSNPDGTYRTGNTMSSPTRYNANGIDLNRNFPDPNQPSTIQQKENVDMITFMKKHRFVISANFHAGAEVFNYPWDRSLSKFHADDAWFYNIGRAYADTVHMFSSPAYMNMYDNGVVRGAVWYIVYGGRQDYVTSELQGREVTIELDYISVTPSAQLSLLWQNNYRSLLGYLENALYGIHGAVQNSVTSAPVEARVFIADHDKDSSHVYSDPVSGRFTRLITPGSWNLTFSSQGFKDTTVSNVIVYAGQRTDLTVRMVPIVNSIDSTLPSALLLYPNPASGEIKVKFPDSLAGSVNVRIYRQDGRIISDYDIETEPNINLPIDINGFASGVYSIVLTNKKSMASNGGRFVVIK